MSSAPTAPIAPPLTDETPADVIPYASPPSARVRITFRGAVTTLVVGGAFLLLSVALLYIAWSIFGNYAQVNAYRGDALLGLGIFVCVLAGFSFITGTIIVFIGIAGVRGRERELA
jgi:hypothetical protein